MTKVFQLDQGLYECVYQHSTSHDIILSHVQMSLGGLRRTYDAPLCDSVCVLYGRLGTLLRLVAETKTHSHYRSPLLRLAYTLCIMCCNVTLLTVRIAWCPALGLASRPLVRTTYRPTVAVRVYGW